MTVIIARIVIMHRVCIAVSALLLAGCALTQTAYLSNGQRVIQITCGSALGRMASCFKAAGSICGPHGFVIYDWSGKPWETPYPDPETLQDDPALAASGLLIACRS
jgi:hypothetical protein